MWGRSAEFEATVRKPRIEDWFGRGCSACDRTGHVCSDDGDVPVHPHEIHPWSGLSDRVDACDHGFGGSPCPSCSPPFPP